MFPLTRESPAPAFCPLSAEPLPFPTCSIQRRQPTPTVFLLAETCTIQEAKTTRPASVFISPVKVKLSGGLGPKYDKKKESGFEGWRFLIHDGRRGRGCPLTHSKLSGHDRRPSQELGSLHSTPTPTVGSAVYCRVLSFPPGRFLPETSWEVPLPITSWKQGHRL